MPSALPTVATVSFFLGTAGLATAEPVRLDYAAPAGCPEGGRFQDEVAARVGAIPFSNDALSIVRVRIRETGDGYAGTVEMPGDAPRDFRDATCGSLAEMMASALATRLDPLGGTAAAAPPPPARAAVVAPPPLAIERTVTPEATWPGRQWVLGAVSLSQIWRTTSATGVRVQVGYDRRVGSAVLGARAGFARHADNFGSSTLPYLGVSGAGELSLGERARLRVGAGAELWINSASDTGIMGEPVFLHLIGVAAPRIRVSGRWSVDIPVELGVMPFFDPKVYTLQIGVQMAYAL